MDEYSHWCQQLFATLSQGGVWAVPRSGLVFTKRGDTMVLTSREAHDSTAKWVRYQQSDYDLIKSEFAKAGITITDGTTKEPT